MGRKNKGGVFGDVDPFEWWGCKTGSAGFTDWEGFDQNVGCPKAEECWPPLKTDVDEVPPKTELVAKELGVDTRAENALFGSVESRTCLEVIPNGEGVGPPKTEVCGMGSGTAGSGSSACSVCSMKGWELSSASTSSINSSDSSWKASSGRETPSIISEMDKSPRINSKSS